MTHHNFHLQTPSGIPTGDRMAQLEALCELLSMSKGATYDAHLEVFGNSNKASV